MPVDDDSTTTSPTSSSDPIRNQQEGGYEINRVAIRIPSFWIEKPGLWFCQLEGQFGLNGITQDTTKFWYVVSQLDNKYAQEVEDIITSPPANNKYETIKRELINRLSTSQQLRLKQLLEHEEIGDRTPSQFLRHLRNLAGNTVQDEFLRTLWLNRLPNTMQAILATQADLSLTKIADIADKIKEASAIAQIHSIPSSLQIVKGSTHDEIRELKEQVKQMSIQIAELSRARSRDRQTGHRRSGSRSSSFRYRDNSKSTETQDICWYHRCYGERAKKCKPPCNYQTGNEPDRH